MTDPGQETRDFGEPFPVTDFWEELVDDWEDLSSADPLGDDCAARFAAIEDGIRSGLLPPEASTSVICRDQIGALVLRLGLKDPEPTIDALLSLAGRHLRPVHRKWLKSDPASTSRRLKELRKAIVALEEALDRFPPVTIDFLQTCHARMPASYRTRATMNLSDFDLMLCDIGHTAMFAEWTLMRQRRQPPKILRQATLMRAVRIVEGATGRTIKYRWAHKDEKKIEFLDEEGSVIREFMALVEPKANERSLVEDLIEIRKRVGRTPD